MKRWIPRIIVLVLVGFAGFWAYDVHRSGLLSLPDIPDGAYTLSYANGFRAIILDADIPDRTGDDSPKYFRSLAVANRSRKYLGLPFEVPPWFIDAWSWCKPPTSEESAYLAQMSADFKRTFENARFEAVCRLDVDGAEVVRGLIFSVPKL